jgi:hypothetical protein
MWLTFIWHFLYFFFLDDFFFFFSDGVFEIASFADQTTNKSIVNC